MTSIWLSYIRSALYQRNSLISRVLKSQVPIDAAESALRQDPVSLVSAILGMRDQPDGSIRRLIIQQADASPGEARLIILILSFVALANKFDQRQGLARFTGPLLFVTQQITHCRQLLSSVRVGDTALTDVYPVMSLPQGHDLIVKQAIYLANPGRLLSREMSGEFGALVVDGTHYRTFSQRDRLLNHPSIISTPMQIVLQPVIDLPGCALTKAYYWLWDPVSKQEIANTIEPTLSSSVSLTRHYWITHNEAIESTLLELYRILGRAMSVGRSQTPQKLLQAWGIYHRFRGLSVPLEYAERAWRRTPLKTTLQEQVHFFLSSEWDGSKRMLDFMEVHGSIICGLIERLYGLFARERGSFKYDVLIELLQTLFAERSDQVVRVVTSTEEEAHILEGYIEGRVKGIGDALESGLLEFIHQREEARRAVERPAAQTVLMGSRTSQYRYLDLFPSGQIHVIAYGYEMEIDKKVLEQALAELSMYSDDSYRMNTLESLGFTTSLNRPIPQSSTRPLQTPEVIVHGFSPQLEVDPANIDVAPFSLEWVSPYYYARRYEFEASSDFKQSTRAEQIVYLGDSDGDEHSYPVTEHVDVYYSETNQLRRISADTVRAGDYIILLLDDRYASLSDRLHEAIDEHRPLEETLLLERWRIAKQKLLARYSGNRSEIYTVLASTLNVDYPALVKWFTDDEEESEVLGPMRFEDFVAIARLSGIYRDEDDLFRTFHAIRLERINRRRLGRMLHRSIKALVGGASYDSAVAMADAIGAPVDDVVNAVELREVVWVHKTKIDEVMGK